jgi:hypothetical protein
MFSGVLDRRSSIVKYRHRATTARRRGPSIVDRRPLTKEKLRIRRKERRMVMLVASKATVAEGEKPSLLARLHSKCPDAVIHVGSFL